MLDEAGTPVTSYITEKELAEMREQERAFAGRDDTAIGRIIDTLREANRLLRKHSLDHSPKGAGRCDCETCSYLEQIKQ